MYATRPIVMLSAVLAMGMATHVQAQIPPPPPPPPGPPPLRRPVEPLELQEIQRGLAERAEVFDRMVSPQAPINFDSIRAAGLPAESEPFRLTARRAYFLAILRQRSPEAFDGDRLDVLARFEELAEQGGADDFARFQADVLEENANGSFVDPGAAYFEALASLAVAERAQRSAAMLERSKEVFTMFARGGASSGISQIDVDRMDLRMQEARRALHSANRRHRDHLDRLRTTLGLPPDAPVVLEQQAVEPFLRVFRELDAWRPGETSREFEIVTILQRLPALPALPELGIEEVSLSERHGETGDLDGPLRAAGEHLSQLSRAQEQAGAIEDLHERRNAREASDAELANVRRLVRELVDLRDTYPRTAIRLLFALREWNEAIQMLVAPPEPGGPGPGRPAEMSQELIRQTAEIHVVQVELVRVWAEYGARRLELARALRLAPGEDWDAFLGIAEPPAEAPVR